MIDSKTSRFFKGIAILMVIGSHFAAGMYVEPVRPAARDFVASLGSYGVDIFFLLSGYGLVKSANKSGITKEFVLRRFVHTYLPYIVIIGLCEVFSDRRVTDVKSLVNLITGGDYWFMHVLFFMYIAFMIVYRVNVLKEVVITVIIMGYTLYLYKDGRIAFWVVSNGAFLIGIYAATFEGKIGEVVKAKTKEFTDKLQFGNICLTMIGFGIMLAAWFSYSDMDGIVAQTIMNMSFTLAVLGICLEVKGGGIIVPALGKYTLYIYLLHMRLFWLIVPFIPEWSYAKVAVVAATISVALCMVAGCVMNLGFEWILKKAGAK